MSMGALQMPAALAAIHRIQAIDACILAIATAMRTGLLAEYGAAMQRVRPVSAYHRIARRVS